MVIDASAIMAILQFEPESTQFAELIEASPVRLVSPINLLEVHLLSRSRRGEIGVRDANRFLADAAFELAPVTLAHLNVARDAFDRFGKGRHPAALNLADCFAYAL